MSETHAAPTREDHDTFCVTEKWALVRGASGKPVTHHRTYELALWDGRILRTRISKPVDKSDYGPSMWSHILREQLQVSSDVFWACVDDGILPDRGGPRPVDVKKAVPLYLREQLRTFGVPDKEILALDAAGAALLLSEKFQQMAEG